MIFLFEKKIEIEKKTYTDKAKNINENPPAMPANNMCDVVDWGAGT